MKQRVWWSVLALAGVVLAGCGKTTGPLEATSGGAPPAGSDAAQVAGVLANNPDLVNEDVWQTDQASALEAGAGFAAIRPLHFWRTITHVERTVDTEFGNPDPNGRPTLALVTVHQNLTGSFNILAGATDPTDTSRSLVRKPLDDLWTRKLVLARVPVPGDTARSRWRLVGTSGVEIHTRNGVTHIQSVRVQSGTLDTTITDPLELHRLRRILLLEPNTMVTLTVTTGDANDVVLFYHHDMRRRFVNNGNGTYTFTFPNGDFPGLRHFGVDALSHGTLFDDTVAYDSNAWVFPFAADPHRVVIDRP